MRWLAKATARCSVSSRLREKDGKVGLSILFHGALQRVLVLAGVSMTCATLVSATSYVNTPHTPTPLLMDVQHDAVGVFGDLLKNGQHVDDEFHRRVIVVQDQDPNIDGFWVFGLTRVITAVPVP